MEQRATTDRAAGGDPGASRFGGIAAWAVRAFGHLVGTTCIALLLALPSVDMQTVEMYAAAFREATFAPDGTGLLLHVGLSALTWSLLAVGFHYARRRWRDASPDRRRLVRANRGSVMVETLIVIVPFLLLTSGIAQLSMRNIAGILADLAVYQGTRAAWVWQPEIGHDRQGTTITEAMVTRRARLASAAALTPTAPSSYEMQNANVQELTALRSVMFSTFSDDPSADGSGALGGGTDAESDRLTYATAFDDDTMEARAARKLTFAYLALHNYQINPNSTLDDDTITVQFDYQFNIVFPWFTYIFENGPPTVGGRDGSYVTISRPRDPGDRYTLPSQSEL